MKKTILLLASAFAATSVSVVWGSTTDLHSLELETDEGQIPQDQRDALSDLLVNRQPAILHPPIYEDELVLSDTIPERPPLLPVVEE